MNPTKEFKDGILRQIYDVRILLKLSYIFSIEKLEESWDILEREFPDDWREFLSLRNWICHEFLTSSVLSIYNLLIQKGNRNLFSISGKSDWMRNYVLGLTQRNRFIWNPPFIKYLFNRFSEKIVLDYGYGGGFYSSYLCSLCPVVYGIEKPEIEKFTIENILFPQNFQRTIEDWKAIEAVWVSEVFHGDSEEEIREIIHSLKEKILHPFMIGINELKYNTILSYGFDDRMKLYTKGGRLYTPVELIEITGIMNPEIINSDYHFTIFGRIE